MSVSLTTKNDGANLRRQIVREAVAIYKRKYPQYYKQAIQVAKEARNSRATVYGSDKEMELRMCVRLPRGLWDALAELCSQPPFLNEKKELLWFMREFPEFCVPQKI
jgi:hypothetical protein